MKRALTLPYHSLFRAITLTTPITISPNYRFLRPSLYSTNTNSYNRNFQWYGFFINGGSSRVASVAAVGALTSVAATIALCEKAEAKEQLPSEFLPKEVVLYQYEACPFCNKVKALLDYYDIPYKIVEVNPLSKKEIQWSDYKKVPILMVDGEKLVDSSDIIDKFCSRILPVRAGEQRMSDPEAEETEETKWRKTAENEEGEKYLEWNKHVTHYQPLESLFNGLERTNYLYKAARVNARWVDNHLVHVLSPNIYRNTSEALESFDYITSNGNFSFTEKITVKYAGAAAMYFVSKKLKKKYNITDERAALYESAETWVNALDGRDFMGGSKPNLADLAVFGVLRPIRYLRSGKDMVENTRIGEWFSRMESVVRESSRVNA